MTLSYISHEKSSKIMLLNKQNSKANNVIIQLSQNLYVQFKLWHK